MTAKISVIVTVYNVEKYIKQCLESVINQTYRNLEIIIVDDGSTDRSREICQKYAEEDKRVRIIPQKNGGPSSARNTGIANATGDYIGFIDGDDFIAENMYELLVKSCVDNKSDLSVCNIVMFTDGSRPTGRNRVIKAEYATGDRKQNFRYLLNTSQSVCNKLFCRRLFRHIRFPLDTLSEDGYVVYDLVYQAKAVSYISLNGYFYRMQRPNSITTCPYKSGDCDIVLSNVRTYRRVTKAEPDLWEDGVYRVVNGGVENIARKIAGIGFLQYLKIYKEIRRMRHALRYVLKDVARSGRIEKIKKIHTFCFFVSPFLFYAYLKLFYNLN